jgi:hypothetical protein
MTRHEPETLMKMDRVWSTLPATPRKPFGSALKPHVNGEPARLTLIGPTRRMTTKALRSPPCPTCGNKGSSHCGCETNPIPGHK